MSPSGAPTPSRDLPHEDRAGGLVGAPGGGAAEVAGTVHQVADAAAARQRVGQADAVVGDPDPAPGRSVACSDTSAEEARACRAMFDSASWITEATWATRSGRHAGDLAGDLDPRHEAEDPRGAGDDVADHLLDVVVVVDAGQLEDRVAQLADRQVELGGDHVEAGWRPAESSPDCCSRLARGAAQRADLEPGGEDPLDDPVVQVAGDAVALLEQRQLGALPVELVRPRPDPLLEVAG